MKCKLLLNPQCYSKHSLFGIVLSGFLCVSAWATNNNLSKGDKNFYLEGQTDSVIPSVTIQQNVSGKVLDENGVPLPGVSVLEKGTNNGASTDFDGNYTLKLTTANSVLVFSYVGYTTKEEVVGSRTTINITMETDQQELEQVVVVGYGTKKKSEVTNAVVQASGDEVKKSTAVSLSNALSGKMAGLYVNQRSSAPGFDDAQILVRGFNTYRNNSALIVIDGVANADPDGLNRLDPNDIESISVLKDASAAIYGAQSAGGVILVTTKRGKTGRPTFNLTTTQSFQSPTVKVRSANAFDYMDVLNASRVLDGDTPDFPDELIASFRNGERRAENWWDALVDGPVEQSRHSLTMRGGTDRIRYFASLGTTSQGGILRGDNKTKLRQYNVRSNLDVSVTKNFEVGLDLSLREKFTQTPQGGAGGEIGSLAFTSPLQEAYIDGDYRYPGEGWSHLNPAARVLSPGYRKFTSDVASGTIKYKYDMPFVKGLSLQGFASIIKTMNYNKSFNYVWDYYEKNSDGDIVKKTSRTVEDIGLTEDFAQSLRVTFNTKLGYKTTINDLHNIDAFVAFEQMEYKTNNFLASRLGYPSPLIDQLNAGSQDRANWGAYGGASEDARQNYFGRLSYDFDGKYFLGFNFRYDGSPIFPKETRWGFFPGVSAGWTLSKESFIPDAFSNFKIRASWGQLGNDRVDPFQYIGAFGYASGWVVSGSDQRGIAATTTPNPNITWEVTETTDIGLELGFLKNKLTFEVDIYKSKTTDILGARQASIPTYTGLSLPDENIGEMESQGIELQAGYKQNFGEFNLRLSGNFSFNENKIIYFDEVPQAEEYQKLEGRPLGSELMYKAIGIYRTQADLDNNVNYPGAGLGDLIFADLNDDGEINGNDRYRNFVSAFPKTNFGLTAGLDYKNFDLTMLFQGQSGAKFRLSNGFNSGAAGNGLAYVANNSYDLDNTNAVLPRIRATGTGAANNDFWYRTSNWLRFKSIELGYNLPKDVISRVGLTNLRLYFSGENLFMIFNSLEKYGAGDPEFLLGNGGGYPNMKNMTLGLNVTF
ncbi:TonB-dependent receptor [Snuella lapsa]|uniref:TonB-dependent receptor n=1 Tax=Snuella lapsa TaxID=870481 RepID=A0ABP6X6D8_9FLAO